MLRAARTLDIAAYRTITYLILIKLSLSARQRDIARFDRMRESYGRLKRLTLYRDARSKYSDTLRGEIPESDYLTDLNV